LCSSNDEFIVMAAPARKSKPVRRIRAKGQVDEDALALMCKALAHPARVKLLNYLADYGTCYFGKLTDILPLAPSTVSQHVSILKEAGLIKGSEENQRTCYCVNAERLRQLKELVGDL
jgi:ArsR family transcriptional regulator, arsenate/arsenite/antimonite-responsive transcriptional repressor